MNRIGTLLLFLLVSLASWAQTKPVKWSSRTEKSASGEIVLVIEGKIDEGWHVYSQFTDENGSLPMIVTFKGAGKGYQLIGKTTESKTIKKYSDVFGVDETFFEHNLVLRQKIKVLKPGLTTISALVDYQVCQESCINDKENFTFTLPTDAGQTVAPAIEPPLTGATDTITEVTSTDTVAETTPAGSPTEAKAVTEDTTKGEKKDPWLIFIFSLLGGVVMTFTPCVFPMIPMTVSFFIKRTSNKAKGKFDAFTYGAFIVLIYVLISVPFHIFEKLDPGIFSDISTNVPLNLFFFLIFVVFAISFFGAFEITMPSRLANRVDNASNSGGVTGIFFMALTLIIVSFSCTGPALGGTLGTVLSTDGGAWLLTIAMFGLGLGLAAPFMIFALFPRLMSNMPKSGGWLNSVKVVFGFVELALALKFFSNADLVSEWHILEREVFIAFWIAIFAAMTLYLFGKLKLPHDDNRSHVSVTSMVLGLISLTFTIYLIPGLWGAPLKLISAFPPPPTYSESPNGLGGVSSGGESKQALPEHAVYGVYDIVSFEDYEEGLAYARKVNKPVFIDFTGKACTNCRLTETKVWSDPRILKMLKEEVVLISLYGDWRKDLPENERYVSKTGKEIVTIGDKWSDFQLERFKNNTRPYYVLIGLDEKPLNTPIPYTPNIEEYYNWMKDGISKFRK
ncbi:MAG TPA: cytochrome c biogenesis protein CcdA [Flavobacterium sp.]|nr:cytochrome c biogenesis protein CcdA [Flavobacterium sp.]